MTVASIFLIVFRVSCLLFTAAFCKKVWLGSLFSITCGLILIKFLNLICVQFNSCCFQEEHNTGATSSELECGKPFEQHLTLNSDEKAKALNSVRHNLFSSSETKCVDNIANYDFKYLLVPKHEDAVDSVADLPSCGEEWTSNYVGSTDNVHCIIVRLPLINRLKQHIKRETPELHVKAEIVDADRASTPADAEPVASATDGAVTTAEAETLDIKKEPTAAAKGLQLARETIASIFGTEVQPRPIMKIPIKRRAERVTDEFNDAERCRTSRHDDVHDHSSKKRKTQHCGCVVLLLRVKQQHGRI